MLRLAQRFKLISFSDCHYQKSRFPSSPLSPHDDLLGGTMEASETVVLCPNCRWSAQGANEQELKAAKDYHALYECPLPAAQTPQVPSALAS
jgi:hypothetical protein